MFFENDMLFKNPSYGIMVNAYWNSNHGLFQAIQYLYSHGKGSGVEAMEYVLYGIRLKFELKYVPIPSGKEH